MTLQFDVPRSAVSVNRTYKRSKQGRLYMSPVAEDFKEAVKAHAFVATRKHRWPDPKRVKGVSVRITSYGSRCDADGPVKLCLDALEGVVYVSDRVVREVTAAKMVSLVRKVAIEVTLLETAA